MDDANDIPPYLRQLFPEISAEVLQLFSAAADNANLLQTDFQTIRDLLELSGYRQPETLHVLLLCMVLALEEGSLCVEVSAAGLERRVSDLDEGPAAAAWARRIEHDLRAGFPNLIGSDLREEKPVIAVESSGRKFLYFQKYLLHETIFHEAFRRRLATAATSAGPKAPRMGEIVRDVLERSPMRMDGRPLVLDRRQKLAVGLALTRPLAVISGGPGTGKTSIVLTLLRCLVRAGCDPERIALAAPTGRAAQRLTDAIRAGLTVLGDEERSAADETLLKLSAVTLHRLLHYQPARGAFGRHRENPIPADVVVIDEVSMVGVSLMSQLLQAASPDTKLILLGDKDQLPSVDPGAVLANLVPAASQVGFSSPVAQAIHGILPDLDIPVADGDGDFVVMLDENYRSEPRIREVARAVNRQDATIVERIPLVPSAGAADEGSLADVLRRIEQQGGCWFWQSGESPRELRRILEAWATHQYLTPVAGIGTYADLVQRCASIKLAEEMPSGQQQDLDLLFQLLNRARLLTLLREGAWGCVEINRFLERQLRPKWDRAAREGSFAGAPVLITRNDYARQLFNGDVGVTLRGPTGGHRVVFPCHGGYVSFPADGLPAHELGFALTVHKSQGSEYGQVLLVLPPKGGRRLLTKEIIYTGITRAKQLAIICGTREVVKFAVSRRIERETGLMSK